MQKNCNIIKNSYFGHLQTSFIGFNAQQRYDVVTRYDVISVLVNKKKKQPKIQLFNVIIAMGSTSYDMWDAKKSIFDRKFGDSATTYFMTWMLFWSLTRRKLTNECLTVWVNIPVDNVTYWIIWNYCGLFAHFWGWVMCWGEKVTNCFYQDPCFSPCSILSAS